MKKILSLVIVSLLLVNSAYAALSTATTSTTFSIPDVFSIEFYSDAAAIRYGDGQITFPAYNPGSDTTMVLTSAWVNMDGKSDVGVVGRTNLGLDWALKIKMSSATLAATNVAVYKPDKVYNRNYTGVASERNTGIVKQWYIMSTSDETIYTGTGGDQNTAPFGVLATFSFAILPTGKSTPSGQSEIGYGNVLPAGMHSLDITYTLTTTL